MVQTLRRVNSEAKLCGQFEGFQFEPGGNDVRNGTVIRELRFVERGRLRGRGRPRHIRQ